MGRVCFSYLATDKTKFVPGMHNTYGNGIERAGWLGLRADFLSIMESARGPRPISEDGIKQRKPGSGRRITGRVIQFTGSSHPPFSVSNSSRSSLGGSETELKMSQTHTISWLTASRVGRGVVQWRYTRSDGFELHNTCYDVLATDQRCIEITY